LHGAFLILHRLWAACGFAVWLNSREGIVRHLWHALAIFFTFHCVCLAWCFFRLTQFAESVACVRKWVECDPAKMWTGPWTEPAVWLALAFYAALAWIAEACRRWALREDGDRASIAIGAVWGVRLATLALAALLAPTGANAAFIYFQF
jgi:alginate O-acetyltransferase complex protein AlgI